MRGGSEGGGSGADRRRGAAHQRASPAGLATRVLPVPSNTPFQTRAGEVAVLSVDYSAEDGRVLAKTAVGRPMTPPQPPSSANGVAAKSGRSGSAAALRAHSSPAAAPRFGGASVPLLLVLPCLVAALAAVAGAYQGVLAVPWLS